MSLVSRNSLLTAALLTCAPAIRAQTPPLTPDIPTSFDAPTASYDYVKRVVMIPMRDGAKLYTVIVIPRGATKAPTILTRTPYNAAKRAERNQSPRMLATLPEGDEVFVADGYIRVFQDVRGKYGSEGDYVLTRPLKGPLNASQVDHSTDVTDPVELVPALRPQPADVRAQHLFRQAWGLRESDAARLSRRQLHRSAGGPGAVGRRCRT